MMRTFNYLLTSLICTLFAAILLTPLSGCTSCSQKDSVDLYSQQNNVKNLLRDADFELRQLISTEERTDENGTPCLVGILSPVLDELLGDLTEAYNSDPETILYISEQELRLLLTDDLIAALEEDPENSALYDFLNWTGAPADLVYNGYISIDDGQEHFDGDEVIDPPTNFDYILKRDTLYSFCRYKN